MNRALLACSSLIFAAACGQSTSRPPARLSGTHSVAVAGDLAFVTSTDRHELRVIDGVKQDFVRALRTGRRPDGTAIDSTVMPIRLLRQMDDVETAALYAYLRTVPERPYGNR